MQIIEVKMAQMRFLMQQILVDNREEKLKVSQGDSHRNNFILYNNLTENIRACSSTFVDKKGHPVGYVPSYDSESIYRKRVEIIQSINKNPRYRYVSGKLKDVLTHIDSEIEKDVQK